MRKRTLSELAMVIFRRTGTGYNGCMQLADDIVRSIEDGGITYIPDLRKKEDADTETLAGPA